MKTGFFLALLLTTTGLRAGDLPNPLIANDGTAISTAEQWQEKRRPELLELLRREMYGQSPGRPENMTFEVFDREPNALGGKATRIQIAIYPGGKTGPRMDLLIYVPNQVKSPPPVFLGLNFWGNHAIHPDPAIRLAQGWVEEGKNVYVDASGVTGNRANDSARGINSSQWPVEEILSRGYALATMHREDVASDRDATFSTGVHALFPELQKPDDNFGTIAAWAWALSGALDVLEKEPVVDAKRVAAFGWSRLGKAALWAGANDDRFAMVISNESGAGGAKLFHRGVGEDVARLNRVFPHWFARDFRKYDGKDTELPFDQHFVISLIAPRPVYVASAIEDQNADPEGEFEGLKAAVPVYRLYTADPFPAKIWPAPAKPVQATLGYHVREGIHDVTGYDWQQFLEFADRRLK